MATNSTSARRLTPRSSCPGSELEITISDEGAGFDPEKVSDPLNPQNLMKTSGRGIFYMKTFMDRIAYSFHPGGGTSLVMTKNLAKGERHGQHECLNETAPHAAPAKGD